MSAREQIEHFKRLLVDNMGFLADPYFNRNVYRKGVGSNLVRLCEAMEQLEQEDPLAPSDAEANELRQQAIELLKETEGPWEPPTEWKIIAPVDIRGDIRVLGNTVAIHHMDDPDEHISPEEMAAAVLTVYSRKAMHGTCTITYDDIAAVVKELRAAKK